MYPQLKCGGRVNARRRRFTPLRLERGLNENGRRGFLPWRMESPLPKKSYGVVHGCHKVVTMLRAVDLTSPYRQRQQESL